MPLCRKDKRLPTSQHGTDEKREILRMFLRGLDMSQEFVTEAGLTKLVLSYLNLEDFDSVGLIELACRARGVVPPLTAGAVLDTCRKFRSAGRVVDEVLGYFRMMIRLAEAWVLTLIRPSRTEEEEGDEDKRELRRHLLGEEARVASFVQKHAWMFPRLFPTVQQPGPP